MNTVLFDLDGTLLPMNLDSFMKIYFNQIAAHFSDLMDGNMLAGHIMASTNIMISSKDYITNEEAFMKDFCNRITGDLDTYKKRFDDFYDTGFHKVKDSTFEMPFVRESVQLLKQKGYNIVLATNPIFPLKAVLHRLKWAGFQADDFLYISCYEKNHYCKPHTEFFKEVLTEIGKSPEECLMVGNDVQEDLIASKLGIKTYLINNCLIHRTKERIVADYQGNYEDFHKFVLELPIATNGKFPTA